MFLSFGPKYFGFTLSFVVIDICWMGHLRLFRNIQRFDGQLLLINLILLMVIAFVPFPTSVISEQADPVGTIFQGRSGC